MSSKSYSWLVAAAFWIHGLRSSIQPGGPYCQMKYAPVMKTSCDPETADAPLACRTPPPTPQAASEGNAVAPRPASPAAFSRSRRDQPDAGAGVMTGLPLARLGSG